MVPQLPKILVNFVAVNQIIISISEIITVLGKANTVGYGLLLLLFTAGMAFDGAANVLFSIIAACCFLASE